MTALTVGGLCTGYGGLELAIQDVLGAHLAWYAEVDPAACRVLTRHHPDLPNHADITTADWSDVEPVDVITAGWPCQPFSLAGKRKGAADERAIWPHVARAVRHLRPRLLLLENVAAIAAAGELARATADLAAVGYVGSFRRVRASDVAAPHQRARIFICARPAVRDTHSVDSDRWPPAGLQRQERPATGPASDPDSDGLPPIREGAEPHARDDVDGRGPLDWAGYAPAIQRWAHIIGRAAPAPTVLGKRGGRQLSARFVEWLMGLPDGWVTDTPGISRNEQLKLLGNGVVPQQAASALRMMLAEQQARAS